MGSGASVTPGYASGIPRAMGKAVGRALGALWVVSRGRLPAPPTWATTARATPPRWWPCRTPRVMGVHRGSAVVELVVPTAGFVTICKIELRDLGPVGTPRPSWSRIGKGRGRFFFGGACGTGSPCAPIPRLASLCLERAARLANRLELPEPALRRGCSRGSTRGILPPTRRRRRPAGNAPLRPPIGQSEESAGGTGTDLVEGLRPRGRAVGLRLRWVVRQSVPRRAGRGSKGHEGREGGAPLDSEPADTRSERTDRAAGIQRRGNAPPPAPRAQY